jgi:hypothetical protein
MADSPLHPQGAFKQQTTVGDIVKSGYGEYRSLTLGGRLRLAGAVGGAAGFLHSRSEDAGLGKTILDTGIGATASIIGSQSLDLFVDQFGSDIKESFGMKKTISVGAMTEANVIRDVEAVSAKTARRAARGFNIGAKGIGALIAVGTLASARNSMDDKLAVEREKARQETKLVRKESKQKKTQRELFGYDKPLDMGQIVMDMWDDRIGHHLMGNSKFK